MPPRDRLNARRGDRCRFYCGDIADPGGVDAADGVDPVAPGVVMLPPDDPVAEPLEPLRRDWLVPVVVPVVPPIGIDPPGIEPIVLPGELPADPVGVLPVMPGAVDALPVPVEVPVVIDPLAPGAAPPPAVCAPAAVANNATAVMVINVFIVLLRLGRDQCGGGQ